MLNTALVPLITTTTGEREKSQPGKRRSGSPQPSTDPTAARRQSSIERASVPVDDRPIGRRLLHHHDPAQLLSPPPALASQQLGQQPGLSVDAGTSQSRVSTSHYHG
jgi:hypothetical protein